MQLRHQQSVVRLRTPSPCQVQQRHTEAGLNAPGLVRVEECVGEKGEGGYVLTATSVSGAAATKEM